MSYQDQFDNSFDVPSGHIIGKCKVGYTLSALIPSLNFQIPRYFDLPSYHLAIGKFTGKATGKEAATITSHTISFLFRLVAFCLITGDDADRDAEPL